MNKEKVNYWMFIRGWVYNSVEVFSWEDCRDEVLEERIEIEEYFGGEIVLRICWVWSVCGEL